VAAVRRLVAPLVEADRATLAAVLGGVTLCTIYLYPGHAGFYLRHFAPAGAGGLLVSWRAQAWQFGAAFVLLFAVPVVWVKLRGEPLASIGLAVGDWRFGLGAVAVTAVLLAGPLYLNAGSPDFQVEYPLVKGVTRTAGLFVAWELCYLVYYIAWETFFRGFWQLGLSRGLGVLGALALQTATSTVMHIGKPAGETMSSPAASSGRWWSRRCRPPRHERATMTARRARRGWRRAAGLLLAGLLAGCEVPANLGDYPDAGLDAVRGGALVGPGVSAGCAECSYHCQANGCYNGWWCDTGTRRCEAPPLSCPAPAADGGRPD
jgi:membrane protease YdiL (CAAX protease family)